MFKRISLAVAIMGALVLGAAFPDDASARGRRGYYYRPYLAGPPIVRGYYPVRTYYGVPYRSYYRGYGGPVYRRSYYPGYYGGYYGPYYGSGVRVSVGW
jgi:hypothetical protein